MSFSSIPVLDLSRSRDPATKPAFLADLRRALLEVGFLYISNTGVDPKLVQAVIDQAHAFFTLPQEKKLEVQMVREKSFLGWSFACRGSRSLLRLRYAPSFASSLTLEDNRL
jgi:isopenicillin N synthase-like dioxygenase